MQHQLYNILEKLIIKNNIRVNKEELKLQLSSHPSYPSLHALTGVLAHFSIPSLALRLVTNEEILEQLPSSFIANIFEEKGEDLVLVEKKKEGIKITNDIKKSKTITNQEFLKLWDGVIVAIEKDDTVEETIQNPAVKFAKWSILTLGVFLTGYLMFISGNLFANLHFTLSVIGLIISAFILKHELGLQSSAANSFCNLSEKTSCDAVLNSKGATLFGLFKLSDVSVIVFLSCCLYWFLSFVSNTINTSIMSIVTLLAFPFVIYSVYYQYNVVKKWCPLCLTIASVLVVQVGVLFLTGFSFELLVFDTKSLVLLAIALIIAISSWSLIKPLLKKKESLEKVEIEHYKFKRNFSLFNVLHNESDTLSSFTSIPKEIKLGNPDAYTQLVIVTSPLCYFCKSAHNDIEHLLTRIGDKLNVIIRFNVTNYNEDNLLYKIVSKLIETYNTAGEEKTIKLLSEVYSDDVNLEKWLNNQDYKASNAYKDVLEKQSDWCIENTINFTPAMYLNGKLFPKEYDRKDLIYFIDDLIEQENISTQINQAIAS